MSSDVKKGTKFFVRIAVWNSDNTLGVDCEGLTARESLDEAIADCVNEIDEIGGEAYVYECVAVRRVIRGRTRVITLKK